MAVIRNKLFDRILKFFKCKATEGRALKFLTDKEKDK